MLLCIVPMITVQKLMAILLLLHHALLKINIILITYTLITYTCMYFNVHYTNSYKERPHHFSAIILLLFGIHKLHRMMIAAAIGDLFSWTQIQTYTLYNHT